MDCHNCSTLRSHLKEESRKVVNLEKELIKCQDYIRKRTNNEDPQTRFLASYKELQTRFERVTEENEQLAERMEESERTVRILQSRIRELEHEKSAANSGTGASPLKSTNKIQNALTIDQLPSVGIMKMEDKPEKTSNESMADLLFIKRILNETRPTQEASELLTSFAMFDSECEEFQTLNRAVTEFRTKYCQYISTLNKNITELENQSGLREKKPLLKSSFPDPFSLKLMCELEAALKRVVTSNLVSAPRAVVSICLICKQPMEEGQYTGFCDGCYQIYHLECGRAFSLKGLTCAAPNCTKKLGGAIWD